MSPLLDQPGVVRSGEELDVARIDAFLKAQIGDLQGAPEINQFAGGASNLTYMLHYPQRDLILRRPPFGHRAKSAHDMLREANIMTALKPVYPYVPNVLATCSNPEVMDCDFYVMERIRGIIPRQNLPEGLNLSVEDTRKLCLSVIDKMIELHQVDYKAAGLESLGKGDGYVARQIDGWSDRFRKARTDDVVDFESVMAWLKAKLPAKDVATCIIHNDFRFDNVVLNPDNPFEVIGVLDWEMATLGDPLMDLGNTRGLLGAGRRRPDVPDDAAPADQRAGHAHAAGSDRLLRRKNRLQGRQLRFLHYLRSVPPRRDRAADLLPLLPRPDQEQGVCHLWLYHQLPRPALQKAD
jgi:aminoglycoside phosphotransferase (APT) family kinase protein